MNGNTPSSPIDPAIAAAQAAATAPDGVAAIAPLQKDQDAALLHPANPHHDLYLQALDGLEALGPGYFKDKRERERAALAIALQAAVLGLARIDRVAANDARSAYFFADTQAVDPAMRGHIAHVDAVHPLTPQRLADALQAQQQNAAIERQQDAMAQQETQRRDAEEVQRRSDPRTTREL